LEDIVAAPVKKAENTAVGIRHADHVAPPLRKKLALTSLTSGGRSLGIVRLWIEAMEFFLIHLLLDYSESCFLYINIYVRIF
jgi:hypothetical protein